MRSRPRFTALLCLALLSTGGDEADAGTLIERTVAFVNRKLILLSDAELTKALLEIDLEAAIERTIDEVLMYDEASRLVTDSQAEEAVAHAVVALRGKAGSAFGEPALRRKALAQLAIARYIELRLRPLVRIEDVEVRRAFNEKVANDPRAPGFGQVAESIRETLERRSLDQKIEEWVAALRRREVVRRPPPRSR